MRKLVRINVMTGRFIDIDTKKLNREAKELRDFIMQEIDPCKDTFDITGKVLPICEKAIRGDFTTSMDSDDLPLRYQVREGMLPNDFDILFANFCTTISGTALDIFDVVEIQGLPHTYIDFED